MPTVGVMLALAGCGRAETAADRHMVEMREAIGKVQAEQDRVSQRAGFEEVEPGSEPKKKSPSPAASAPRTVQIGDDDDARESDDPNDPSARPEIRLQGPPGAASRGVARSKSSTRSRADDDGTRPSILDPEAKKAYEAALAFVHSRQYDRALEGLAAFLVRWPDHPYAENALYWRGESFFARGEYLRAAEQFEAVLARFGSANKAPDSLLKLGMCHDRLGSAERAKEYWDRLRREHPRSDAAKRIPSSSSERGERGPMGADSGPASTRGPKESR